MHHNDLVPFAQRRTGGFMDYIDLIPFTQQWQIALHSVSAISPSLSADGSFCAPFRAYPLRSAAGRPFLSHMDLIPFTQQREDRFTPHIDLIPFAQRGMISSAFAPLVSLPIFLLK
jgi:hypothetical protein